MVSFGTGHDKWAYPYPIRQSTDNMVANQAATEIAMKEIHRYDVCFKGEELTAKSREDQETDKVKELRHGISRGLRGLGVPASLAKPGADFFAQGGMTSDPYDVADR